MWERLGISTTYVIKPVSIMAVRDHLNGRILPIRNIEGVWHILCEVIIILAVCSLDIEEDVNGFPAKNKKKRTVPDSASKTGRFLPPAISAARRS